MVLLTKEEKRQYCKAVLDRLPDIRRVLQLSQAKMSDLCGISRARLIALEKKKVNLTWGQMTGILFVCGAYPRGKEWLYVNEILPDKLWQFVQQKEEDEKPEYNVCVPEEIIMSYEKLKEYNRNRGRFPQE